MTTTTLALPRWLAAHRGPPTGQLARIEGRRMLRHPAPWLGLVLSAWWLR